jgi:hypothetical protein
MPMRTQTCLDRIALARPLTPVILQGDSRAAPRRGLDPVPPWLRRTDFPRRGTALRIPSACLAVVLGLSASFAASAAEASKTLQVKQLEPVTLAPTVEVASNPLAAIWKDKLAEIRARLAGKSPAFFAATFDDGEAAIIISVSVDDPACENLSGALGRPTAGSDCPMRVARVQRGDVAVLGSSEHFVLPASIDASGDWGAPSPGNSVSVTFDPGSQSLAISERIDGENADAVNPNPILLKY